jgi:hypothetical protein
LQANCQIAGKEAEADDHAVGMEGIADQVVQIMAIEAFLDCLLAAPALPVGLR